jgi:xanthine dehydrogenase accessory factor
MTMYASLFRSVARAAQEGRRTAFCVVIRTQGSAPQVPGAALLVREDMGTEGTLGGGCVEAEVRTRAFELLQRGRSGLLTFDLDRDYGWDDGLICGGAMEVTVQTISGTDEARRFLEAAETLDRGSAASLGIAVEHEGRMRRFQLHVEAPAKLIIAGAGHVGAEVARLAVGLDFATVVIDDRAEFTDVRRLPAPIRPVVGDIAGTLRKEPIDANTYIVVVTRGHKHDEQALRAAIDRPARYLGMIGSRRKVKLVLEDLAALGVSREKLAQVHAPIGLSIGAVTVQEIAVSIVAELIQVRRTEKPTHVEEVQ